MTRARADGPSRARVNRRRGAGTACGAAKSRHRSRSTIRDQWAKPPTHSTDTRRAIKAASADAIAASRTRLQARGCLPTVQRLRCPGRSPRLAAPANSAPRTSGGGGRCSPGTDTSTSMSATSIPACEANRKASTIESPGTNGITTPIVGWSATLEGRHRRRPAARGPFERRPERRRQFQRHHGGLCRGKRPVDDPAEGPRRSDTTARPSGCGTSGRTPIR